MRASEERFRRQARDCEQLSAILRGLPGPIMRKKIRSGMTRYWKGLRYYPPEEVQEVRPSTYTLCLVRCVLGNQGFSPEAQLLRRMLVRGPPSGTHDWLRGRSTSCWPAESTGLTFRNSLVALASVASSDRTRNGFTTPERDVRARKLGFVIARPDRGIRSVPCVLLISLCFQTT